MIKLSILIPSIITRKAMLDRLLAVINPQLTDGVQVITDIDNGEISIGNKRNRLLEKATGEFLCFIDDDDTIAEDYISTMLETINNNPTIDAIGFLEEVWTLNKPRNIRILSGEALLHLNPVRSSIAKTEAFIDSNLGEDRNWIKRVIPKLKHEIFIDKVLYKYLYVDPDKRNEYTNAMKLQEILFNTIGEPL